MPHFRAMLRIFAFSRTGRFAGAALFPKVLVGHALKPQVRCIHASSLSGSAATRTPPQKPSSLRAFDFGSWREVQRAILATKATARSNGATKVSPSYRGDFREGRRQGHGTQVGLWGTYTGSWVNDRRVGYGKEVYADGSRYEGEWLGGEYFGQGKLTYADGAVLEGEFRKGHICNGSGKFIVYKPMSGQMKKTSSVSGDSGSAAVPGVGATVWSTYVGHFVDGGFHGQGTLTYATGETLRGEFKAGKIYTGEGVVRYYDSEVMQAGSWVEGKVQGAGTEVDGSLTFTGEFKDDHYHGAGIITYKTGETLQGEFRKGKIYSGQGTFKYTTPGDYLQGTWVGGKLQGRGRIVKADWRAYEGEIVDGKFHGQGALTYPTGEVLRGEFRQGKVWMGEGAMRQKDGAVLTGKWRRGEFAGKSGGAAS